MVSQALLRSVPTLRLGEHTVKTVQLQQTFANYTQLVIFHGINPNKPKQRLDLTLYLRKNSLNHAAQTTVLSPSKILISQD